jgi:hypothetical protein
MRSGEIDGIRILLNLTAMTRPFGRDPAPVRSASSHFGQAQVTSISASMAKASERYARQIGLTIAVLNFVLFNPRERCMAHEVLPEVTTSEAAPALVRIRLVFGTDFSVLMQNGFRRIQGPGLPIQCR